jgi:hypothetical protein
MPRAKPGAGTLELERKAQRLQDAFPGYAITCRILGLGDVKGFLR